MVVGRRRKYKHKSSSVDRIRKYEKYGVGLQGKEMEQECAEYSEGALSKLTVYKQSLNNFSLKNIHASVNF